MPARCCAASASVIWEVRGGRRHFTFSKIMAWLALDRTGTTRNDSSCRRRSSVGGNCATTSTRPFASKDIFGELVLSTVEMVSMTTAFRGILPMP